MRLNKWKWVRQIEAIIRSQSLARDILAPETLTSGSGALWAKSHIFYLTRLITHSLSSLGEALGIIMWRSFFLFSLKEKICIQIFKKQKKDTSVREMFRKLTLQFLSLSRSVSRAKRVIYYFKCTRLDRIQLYSFYFLFFVFLVNQFSKYKKNI